MKNKLVFAALGAVAALGCLAVEQFSGATLPPPDKTGGKPLMQCLTERKSSRDFLPGKTLDAQTLSDLLYAAYGMNRPEQGRHTVPTAMNRQDVAIFVLLPDGVFRYDAAKHGLVEISTADERNNAGGNPGMFAKSAAVVVFVSDSKKIDNERYAAFHAGCASQNISLFCASAGLGTVVVGSYNDNALRKILKLNDAERIQMTQAVGFAK